MDHDRQRVRPISARHPEVTELQRPVSIGEARICRRLDAAQNILACCHIHSVLRGSSAAGDLLPDRDRGTSMTGGSPLARELEAIERLRAELATDHRLATQAAELTSAG
jgi:hypothetical protein